MCRALCLLCAQCMKGAVPTVCMVHVGYSASCVHSAYRVQYLLCAQCM